MESLEIQQKNFLSTNIYIATTDSAPPLKVKPKLLSLLRFKGGHRYGGGGGGRETKFEILNMGVFLLADS